MANLTIEFEDKGQDFLEWDIEVGTGKIIGCRPFQGSVWVGKYVQGLAYPSCKVTIADVPASEVTYETDMQTIKYPFQKITKK